MIDSHAHLDFPQFDADREEAIRRAAEAGVETIITIGIDLPSSRAAIRLAETYPSVYAAVGVHPHHAEAFDEPTFDELLELTAHPKVVAVGEIGLDFYRDYAPHEIQRRAFRRQLALAETVHLPAVVHSRNAYPEVLVMLEQWVAIESSLGAPRGVLHCFGGTAAEAQQGIDLGFLVSIAGPVTYPKPGDLPEIARTLPLGSLLVETDAPYLAPQAHRGRRNEPAFVAMVVTRVAELRGEPAADVAAATAANARRVFRLSERPV